MATSKNNCKKSELLALYRLEFYKNKKQWKLSGEKAKELAKPLSEPRNTASGKSKLNMTYTTDPVVNREEKAPSSINNAFIHEMPTDDISPQGILQFPVTSDSQTDGPKPDLVSTSLPQFHSDIWDIPERNSQPQDFYKNWSTGQDYLDEQPLNTQNPDIWPNKFQGGTNSSQPVDSLQLLLKTASLSWTQNASPEDIPPPSNVDYVDAWTEASASLKTQPQYRYIENNSTQKLQFNLENLDIHNNEEYPTSPAPGPATPRFTRQNAIDPATQYQKPSTPDRWNDQRNSLKYPDIWPTQPATGPSGSTAGISRSIHGAQNLSESNIRMSEKYIFDLCNERPQFFVPDIWVNQDYAESSRPDSWTCPAPPSTPECRNVWTNQLWQDEQQYWQNSDKEWRNPPEVSEFCDEEETSFPKMRYGSADVTESRASVDQFMVKSGPEEYTDVTPEQVHRNTNQWLRRLMGIYMEDDDCDDPCDPLCDHSQNGGSDSSAEFIRGAHEVAHSSENDTTELTECVCAYAGGRLCAAPRGRLARATCRAAAALRLLLAEHVLRDRLRLETNSNTVNNRDSNLFAGEYVISGSHITRSDAELQMASADSVIKIKMGRPYRLERNLDN